MHSFALKRPSDSAVTMTQLVMPADTNHFSTIFGGKVMSWMDIAAAISAARHARKPVVTAAVDALHFLHPIHLGDHVEIKAMVNFVSRTSMEIGIRITAQNPIAGDPVHTCSAYFTFVALDEKGRPLVIDQVYPETPDEVRRFEEGKLRYLARRELAARHKANKK